MRLDDRSMSPNRSQERFGLEMFLAPSLSAAKACLHERRECMLPSRCGHFRAGSPLQVHTGLRRKYHGRMQKESANPKLSDVLAELECETPTGHDLLFY